MAKQIIIDWQRDSLIAAVGQGSGSSVRLEKVSRQSIGSLPADSDGGDDRPPSGDAAQALSRAIDELGVRKSDVIIVASRDVVEVRTISVPRIDANELPDVIRFQAQRQLANMGDQWTLDYVLLPEEPGQEMLTALVGVIAPGVLQQMETACAQAGVQLTHIALRPIEIARFATASGRAGSSDAAMVICLSEQDADLLILNRGSVVQVRGTRLPSDTAQLRGALSGELRRSLMAASNQLAGKPLSHAVVVAAAGFGAELQSHIAEILGCDVVVVDPCELLGDTLPQRSELASAAANRIVGLAGALNFAAAEQKTKLDFKDPKKRPPPKSKTTTYLLAAAAAALLALGGIYWWSSLNHALDEDLAMYRDQVESQKELTKAAEGRIAELKEVEKFLAASPNWLDEIAYIAERIPAADKVLIGDTTFSVLPDGSGRITMPVAVDSSSTIGLFEKSLRDDAHVVSGKNTLQLDAAANALYKWTVQETVAVKGRGWNLVETLESGRSANPTPAVSPAAAEVTQK